MRASEAKAADSQSTKSRTWLDRILDGIVGEIGKKVFGLLVSVVGLCGTVIYSRARGSSLDDLWLFLVAGPLPLVPLVVVSLLAFGVWSLRSWPVVERRMAHHPRVWWLAQGALAFLVMPLVTRHSWMYYGHFEERHQRRLVFGNMSTIVASDVTSTRDGCDVGPPQYSEAVSPEKRFGFKELKFFFAPTSHDDNDECGWVLHFSGSKNFLDYSDISFRIHGARGDGLIGIRLHRGDHEQAIRDITRFVVGKETTDDDWKKVTIPIEEFTGSADRSFDLRAIERLTVFTSRKMALTVRTTVLPPNEGLTATIQIGDFELVTKAPR